jgi:hypothetical protein
VEELIIFYTVMKNLICLLIAVFFSGTARSADVDTVVLLKSSPFFTDFLKKKSTDCGISV